MSVKIVTSAARECDLDGRAPATVFRFAFDGRRYQADLCAPHVTEYRAIFRRLANAGRRRREASRTAATRQRTRDMRAWGRSQGYDLPDRGRLPGVVVTEYEAAEARAKTSSVRAS